MTSLKYLVTNKFVTICVLLSIPGLVVPRTRTLGWVGGAPHTTNQSAKAGIEMTNLGGQRLNRVRVHTWYSSQARFRPCGLSR